MCGSTTTRALGRATGMHNMKAHYAGNHSKRRTVIYPRTRAKIQEQEFRDNLDLLGNILASYETAAETYSKVLLSPDDDEKEVRTRRRP